MRLPEPVDNCGQCLTPERAIPVRPYLVQEDVEPDGIRAYCRCGDCGHRWFTGWDTQALAEVEDPPPWWAESA